MSQLTKNAIVETTVRLSQSRPINKITVRDIVEACGITRNTFYYHFHDIYEVLECAIELELEQWRASWNEDTEEALFALFKLFIAYKKLWNNLYRSLGHEQLSLYISKKIRAMLSEYMTAQLGEERPDPEDLSLILLFCQEMLTGVFFRWLGSDTLPMEDAELRRYVNRVLRLFDGQLQLALENLRKTAN